MNRLCVAISRARCGLYLFGNHAHLAKASRKGWKVHGIYASRCSFSLFKQGCRLLFLPPLFPFLLLFLFPSSPSFFSPFPPPLSPMPSKVRFSYNGASRNGKISLRVEDIDWVTVESNDPARFDELRFDCSLNVSSMYT